MSANARTDGHGDGLLEPLLPAPPHRCAGTFEVGTRGLVRGIDLQGPFERCRCFAEFSLHGEHGAKVRLYVRVGGTAFGGDVEVRLGFGIAALSCQDAGEQVVRLEV